MHETQTKYGKIKTLTPMTAEEIEAQCALVSAACDDDPGEAGEEEYIRAHKVQKVKRRGQENHQGHATGISCAQENQHTGGEAPQAGDQGQHH